MDCGDNLWCTVNPVHPERIWLATHTFVTCVSCAEVLTHPECIRFIVHAQFLCAFIFAWKIYELWVSRMCNINAILTFLPADLQQVSAMCTQGRRLGHRRVFVAAERWESWTFQKKCFIWRIGAEGNKALFFSLASPSVGELRSAN